METKTQKRELRENEIEEIFMSQVIEESDEHRYGLGLNLLAENRSFDIIEGDL